jgi:glucuronoarabinoxylan endo-1,4-beta-xylanase
MKPLPVSGLALMVLAVGACGNETPSGGGTGGAPASGGITTGNGGTLPTGGAANSGGSPAPSGGKATGGASTGGTAIGGKATGGTSTGGGASGGKAAGGGAGVSGTPNVVVDLATQYQTIEGFGFFGAQDVWWGSSSDMWSDAWGTQVINDLGISIWRNEYYSEEANQDANWSKQLPVVQGLKRIADLNRVPLKFIFTVWSAPSSMKCTVDSVQAGQNPCTLHPDGLKNGGTLDPSKYAAYAQWLIAGIQKYHDAGVELYALSPQNEPLFVESYNSCVYATETAKLNAYSRLLKAIAPTIKQAYPNVKLFGTENMLGLEGQPWTNISYSAAMDAAVWPSFDVLAYHGYQDGVAPTASSQLAQYWINVRDNYDLPQQKPAFMTETSGYNDTWGDANGPRALGYAIYSALAFGRVSAWVWWQGSALGQTPDEYTLMEGTQLASKRYYVSKQFYRFIRPGAKMVSVTSTDSNLFVVAFQHPAMNSFSLVAINAATQDKPLVLGGTNVPATYGAYRTSATENAVSIGSVTNGSIMLKADSITTLVNGNVYE